MIKPVVNGASKGHIQRAQAKLFLIMCYYTLFGVIVITSYTLLFSISRRGTYSFQSDLDCGQPPDITLASVSIILGGLMPDVILIFTMKCSCFKKCCQSAHDRVPQTPL